MMLKHSGLSASTQHLARDRLSEGQVETGIDRVKTIRAKLKLDLGQV